jgi:DNA invertase Pin-like site-specific DNA recombinase
MARVRKKPKVENIGRKNAVIYARYSSSSQSEQSIEGQLRVNTEFAEKNGYTIVDTYIDRAMSGKSDDRPAFQKMVKDSINGTFDYVIVYKLDRFSRNRYDSAINKKILQENNVKIISSTEAISETPEGILFESIIVSFAEYYVAELSQKIRRGIRESHIKGQYTSGSITLGYELKDHKLYIVEEEANSVREIFTMCARGMKLSEIVKYLNDKGIKAKNGKPFKLMTISRILNNEHYTGIAHYEDGTYDNIYPKIIDKSIFEACRTKNQINNRRPRHFINNYILSGKLYCMECGLPMIGESGTSKQKVQFHYYKCTGRKRKLNDCKKHTVRQDYLEDLVIQEIHRFILQERFLKNVSIAMVEEYNKLVSNNPEISLAEKELRRNANQINNLLNAIKDGLYNDLTKNELEKLQKEKQDLEIKLATLKNANNSPIDIDKCYHFLYSLLKLDLNLIANRKKLINTFVRKVMLSDEEIKILFYPLNKPGVFNESNKNLKEQDDNGDTSSSSVTVSSPIVNTPLC